MTPKNGWHTGVLILSLILSIVALGVSINTMGQKTLPDWVEIQEGPIAHGVDKFYRSAYFMGNVEVAGDLDAAGNLSFGYDASSYAFDFGTDTVTDTLALTHANVTTPTIGLCTLAEDPDATEALCTISIADITATLKLWNAGATSAGSAGTLVHWMIVGQE